MMPPRMPTPVTAIPTCHLRRHIPVFLISERTFSVSVLTCSVLSSRAALVVSKSLWQQALCAWPRLLRQERRSPRQSRGICISLRTIPLLCHSVDAPECVQGTGEANVGIHDCQNFHKLLPCVANVEVALDMALHLGLTASKSADGHKGQQFPGLQIQNLARIGVAFAWQPLP